MWIVRPPFAPIAAIAFHENGLAPKGLVKNPSVQQYLRSWHNGKGVSSQGYLQALWA